MKLSWIPVKDDEYGKVGEVTVRRGKIHDYDGMKLDFSDVGSFIVDLEDYLDRCLRITESKQLHSRTTSLRKAR